MRHEGRLRKGVATQKEIQHNMRLLQYHRSGELDADLNEATLAHGFGHLRLDGGAIQNLTAPCCEDYLASVA